MPVYSLTIPNWIPARLNQMKGHWSRGAALKKIDREMIAGYALQARDRIPQATSKRRVSLTITLANGERAGDPDAYFKSVNDALVHAGLLKNDSHLWVVLGDVVFERGAERATTIILQDLD